MLQFADIFDKKNDICIKEYAINIKIIFINHLN